MSQAAIPAGTRVPRSNRIRIRRSLREELRQNGGSYLLALPAIAYSLVFGYFTMPYLVMAFKEFSYRKTFFELDWIGLANFEFFFASQTAWRVTFNTLRLNALFIVIGTTFALLVAIVLNELKFKTYSKVAQSTYLFPFFISWVVASYIIYSLFSTQFGIINKLLTSIGLEARNWYTDARPWPAILTTLNVWKFTGQRTVIYLAAIVAIDPSLYEVAEIDGASRLQKIRFITMPHLLPVVAILSLLAIGRIFYADFGMIYAIIRDNGLLYPTSDVIDTYVFRALRIHGNPAQAMAVNFYQSAVGFVLVFGSNWLVRKLFPQGALF
jgi:putative aldouronate transport system permease protein